MQTQKCAFLYGNETNTWLYVKEKNHGFRKNIVVKITIPIQMYLKLFYGKRSNEVKITERAVRLELSLQHRPDAILNLGGLLSLKCLWSKIVVTDILFGSIPNVNSTRAANTNAVHTPIHTSMACKKGRNLIKRRPQT